MVYKQAFLKSAASAAGSMLVRSAPHLARYAYNKVVGTTEQKAISAANELKKPTVAEVKDIVNRTINRDKERMDSPQRTLLSYNFSSGKVVLAPSQYFPELVQGTEEGQRLGNRIHGQRLRLYLVLSNGQTGRGMFQETHIRLTFARWRFADGSNTLPSLTTDVSGYGTPLDQSKWDIKKSFHFTIKAELNSSDQPVFKQTFKIVNINMDRVLRYSDATTSCPNNFPYYLIFTSNNTDNTDSNTISSLSNVTLYFKEK